MFNYVQDGYRKKDYKLHFLQRKSADNYVINYEITNGEVTNNTLVKHEFFNDRVTITMIYCAYKRSDAKPIVIGPDFGNESQKKLYYAMRRAYADSIFEYLEITENTEPLNKAG